MMTIESTQIGAMTTVESVLTVNRLTVDTVGEHPIRLVDHMDLDLRAGEVMALVGESGSGKTLTARALLGMDRTLKYGGEIRYGGENLLEADQRRMRQIRGSEIGIVFQDPLRSLDPVMKIGLQVAEPLLIRGVRRSAALRRAADILGEMGVTQPLERLQSYPHELSGGMRQRVALAMALIAEPKVLIADEPTTALDVRVQARVLDLIRNVAREQNLAVLLITHDLGVVANSADRVAVMYAGRSAETGTVDEVFARPSHPYTTSLLAAVPRIDRDITTLQSIPGIVVHPAARPKGCAFTDRCPVAMEHCAAEPPARVALTATHQALCHRLEEEA